MCVPCHFHTFIINTFIFLIIGKFGPFFLSPEDKLITPHQVFLLKKHYSYYNFAFQCMLMHQKTVMIWYFIWETQVLHIISE